MLLNHGITKEYTNAQLDSFILEAKLLVDMPFMMNSVYEDYEAKYRGKVYYTHEYPILTNSVQLTIDGKRVPILNINNEGRIIFDKKHRGTLECKYTVGLSDDDINNYLIPIVVCLIEDAEGGNISSITEGDVSLSYDTTGYSNRTLDSLVNGLRNKYGARVRLV